MRSGKLPFKFDLRDLLLRALRQFSKRVGTVTLSLPHILSVSINVKDPEKRIAREIVIRLKDRRVLSAWECCNDCIERALASLHDIRKILVDKEVELSEYRDGALYLLVEAMQIGIRQFLTFEEGLRLTDEMRSRRHSQHTSDPRQAYFDGLELLRDHLSHCLGQVAKVAGMSTPKDSLLSHYQGPWPDAYLPPS